MYILYCRKLLEECLPCNCHVRIAQRRENAGFIAWNAVRKAMWQQPRDEILHLRARQYFSGGADADLMICLAAAVSQGYLSQRVVEQIMNELDGRIHIMREAAGGSLLYQHQPQPPPMPPAPPMALCLLCFLRRPRIACCILSTRTSWRSLVGLCRLSTGRHCGCWVVSHQEMYGFHNLKRRPQRLQVSR